MAAAGRSWLNRAGSAVLVILGGLFWIGGLRLFTVIVGRWDKLYSAFDIKGGLPTPTQTVIDLERAVAGHWLLVLGLWAAATMALAIVAIRMRWHRTLRATGWFCVLCSVPWYLAIFLLLYVLLLPLLTITTNVGHLH